ncbi:MAG TPA: amidohydrolase family protein [Vicinamibacterales bacterium]|nr:amidohydrolase family protein [Vicinamibacterales bacterium]
MIFDAHAHVYPAAGGFWKRASTAEELIAAMDRSGVSRATVIAIEPHITAEEVCDAATRFPARLVPIGSVDPFAADAPAAIDHQVKALGVRGIKLHPRLQRIRFEDLARVEPIAVRCGVLGVPLIVCSFAGGGTCFGGVHWSSAMSWRRPRPRRPSSWPTRGDTGRWMR